MAKKKISVIDIGKAIAQISFTTLAAIGSATGNVIFAGIAAFPSAVLTAFDAYREEDRKHQLIKETVVIIAPDWWSTDVRSWDNLCEEIDTKLPDVLKQLFDVLQKENEAITLDNIYQKFVDILLTKRLTWVTDSDKKQAAEYIAPIILKNINDIYSKEIENIFKYKLHLDIYNISQKTTEVAISAAENAIWLKKIYDELRENNRKANLADEAKQFNPSLLSVLLTQTLASMTPQHLIATETIFNNPLTGKQLLEDITKLIEAFEFYIDEIMSVLSEVIDLFRDQGERYYYESMINRVMVANRKLTTISNEMRSIYRNIDKKFMLTSKNKALINHISSICAQIVESEEVLSVGIKINPFTLAPSELYDWFQLAYDKSFPIEKLFNDANQLNNYLYDYHLALIELNNYKIALREAIEGIDNINC